VAAFGQNECVRKVLQSTLSVPKPKFGRPLLYINDISRVLPGENVKLLSDDKSLFVSGIAVKLLNQRCNYCTETLNPWFIANR